MSRVLVRFHWDCGRQGDVEGIFVTTKEELERNYDKSVYFGEILGKHSEVYGTLDRKDITVESEDQDFIDQLVLILGTHIGGYNPLDAINSDDEEE